MSRYLPGPVQAPCCQLGEGPVWDDVLHRLYWVDISGETLHWHNRDQSVDNYLVGQKIGAVALTTDHRLIAALENGFYFIDPVLKTIALIVDTEHELPSNRFNDGKCDPQGRFWAGSMSMTGDPDAGTLYMLDAGLHVFPRLNKLGCSNGLAWSPDQKTMYFIDTLAFCVTAFDFDTETGEISSPRKIIEFNPEEGLPDGMTIDTDGMLWIAMWNGWAVCRYNPADGKLLQKMTLPVSQVTSCTFGGASLSDLYITTAKEGLSPNALLEQPLAGHLFIIENMPFQGLPANRFFLNAEL